ncbi:T. brucei spp.-specific protein [Trypanosoma brucei gambiense DAL972]|uniref:T. brucei spp.-specific protein n=1 Tax=Trypanosoma brucei gambiense (strain MHOM/CI/86/DAL972) TaxID=679716 RepID=C9ZUG8_TRYB9|nr:T. brucei spp.-specific protein [Trypanosoma brucei gambiense DAL972]CBH13056.1 T. brucei spp.-specific protein [Trypanosoma brucei gambiense DAL972]|eukprot:XP_011775333.1 T. brucei spp.-specific protein [Trypanosoma brucei gambiense DAL972]
MTNAKCSTCLCPTRVGDDDEYARWLRGPYWVENQDLAGAAGRISRLLLLSPAFVWESVTEDILALTVSYNNLTNSMSYARPLSTLLRLCLVFVSTLDGNALVMRSIIRFSVLTVESFPYQAPHDHDSGMFTNFHPLLLIFIFCNHHVAKWI